MDINNKISIPFENKRINNKGKCINFNLNKNELKKALQKILYNVEYIENLYIVINCFYDELEKRYESLTTWYTFLLDAASHEMIILICKLLSSHPEDLSFFNILRYVAIKEQYDKYINNLHQEEYNTIIDSFNKKIVPKMETFKQRRNKVEAHLSKNFVLNKTDEYNIYMNNCKIVVDYINKNARKLYEILFDEAKPEMYVNVDYKIDIYNFVNLLNDNGKIKSNMK